MINIIKKGELLDDLKKLYEKKEQMKNFLLTEPKCNKQFEIYFMGGNGKLEVQTDIKKIIEIIQEYQIWIDNAIEKCEKEFLYD